jgi:hypothetical protein
MSTLSRQRPSHGIQIRASKGTHERISSFKFYHSSNAAYHILNIIRKTSVVIASVVCHYDN